jgi:Chromo (CHRromatin Organisation MOdifier) domain
VGDLSYVKTYVVPKELSKKLIFPAVGPFLFSKVGTDRRTFKVQTPESKVTVSADRIRKCPAPQDLPASIEFSIAPAEMTASSKEVFEEGLNEMDEFVVERIVSHRKDEYGIMYLKILWFGYGPEADTWEPLLHVPQEMTRQYVKRKKLSLTEFLIPQKL